MTEEPANDTTDRPNRSRDDKRKRRDQPRPKTSRGVLFIIYAGIAWLALYAAVEVMKYRKRNEERLNRPNWMLQMEHEMRQQGEFDRRLRERGQ